MMFLRLLAVGILAHQSFALCYEGKSYLTSNFLPVLGLGLTSRLKCALHLVLIALAVLLLLWPQWWPLYPALFITISLVIASYSFRLSNHLIVLWFMMLTLCLDLGFQILSGRVGELTPFLFAGIQVIVILTYLISFFHKLNAEYLRDETSCGARLAKLYLEDRKIINPRLVKIYSFLSIYGTLALEGLIPLLLLVPATRPLAICLAIVLHLPLGLLCNFHFSSVMYAGLSAFIPPEEWPHLLRSAFLVGWPPIVIYLALGLFMGWRLGLVSLFRYRRAALVVQILFCIYTIAAMVVGIVLFSQGPLSTFGWQELGAAQLFAIVIVTALFLLNGLSPYLGLKTEFSLAMFSNLRHEPWRHLLIPSHWRPFNLASYVRIERIEGLPQPVRHKPGDTLNTVLIWLLAREEVLYSSYFFHEGLKLVCQSVEPQPVVRVVYVERGERHEIEDYARHMSERCHRYLRATLFPYGISNDPSIPYCS
ncbi:MAG TPA: hypothetical protein VF543_12265 [Pyrinomonadaceae bacterium]|jgi:hypothetical protein